MDLGYKTLNNLTSKDITLQKQAAREIIMSKDIKAFEILNEKSEFIFDFLKEKINNNLLSAVNENNVSNLYAFMKIYSEDFKDFIINSLIKFNSKEIEEKMLNLLQTGSDEEKTYSVCFYTKIKNENSVCFAKKYISSDFTPLKNASIRLLSEYGEKEEFQNAVSVLNSASDDYEKMNSAEFIALYGGKEGFKPVFNYLENNPTNEIIASNLLLIKDFRELINNDEKNHILKIFAALIWNFPDNITFEEINYYLQEGVLEYLLESDDDFASLLLLYTKEKINFALFDEAYSIDFNKNSTKEAKDLLYQLNSMTDFIDKEEAIISNFESSDKIKILMSLYLADKNQKELIENLALNNKDNEIKTACVSKLKENNVLENDFLNKLEKTIENETVKVLIKSLSV